MDQYELLEQIRERVLASPKALNMTTWHTCETTHCLAGWAQFIDGDMRKDSESEGKRLIPAAAQLFFETEAMVRAWLQSRAWDHANRPAFYDELRKMGIHVVTGNDVYEWSGGDCWASDNATINQQSSQTGGQCWASGNATINQQASQTGGQCWAYGNATINQQASQTGGDCLASDNATIKKGSDGKWS